MRNLNLVAGGLVGALVALVSVTFAGFDTGPTIQECAKLLPQGKSYAYAIEGTVDTTGAEPKMTGTFTVGETAEQDTAVVAKDVQGFSRCVEALIK